MRQYGRKGVHLDITYGKSTIIFLIVSEIFSNKFACKCESKKASIPIHLHLYTCTNCIHLWSKEVLCFKFKFI